MSQECHETPSFQSLVLTENRKVKFEVDHKNTFGLLFGPPNQGGTCPGATKGVGGCMALSSTGTATCYMAKITKMYPNVHKALSKNTELVQGKSYEDLVQLLENTVTKWRLNNPDSPPYFRMHYSGDFFSVEYARAWATVVRKFPQIKFWVYTRSFTKEINVIPYLVGISNLAVYLSVDPKNYERGKEVYDQYKHHKNLSLAYMGNEAPSGAFKFIKCPEITGVVKNTSEAGACSKCKLCFTHSATISLRKIQFPIH